jgi:hypothetical protein
MKILIYLHHPAHFHLFKNVISSLAINNELIILATKKDILEDLLQNEGLSYINVLPNGRKDNKLAIAIGLLKQDFRLLKICLKYKPDILVGTSTEITHIGKLLNIPSLFLNEDDIDVIPLVGKLAYPFAKHLLVPIVCNTGKWNPKTINYHSFHELAYLHPNNFEPNRSIVSKTLNMEKPYFILRFAKLGAHHDNGIKGISNDLTHQIINLLEPYGNILITSERELDQQLEKYRININPNEIHHFMYYTSLFIGDSQTMAAESAVLGVPFIRYNDFVGRISYLEELENKYQLGFGIKTNESDKLIQTIKGLLEQKDCKAVYQERRRKMLSEKINYADFLSWFIENYPSSVDTMKANPDYQFNFK